MSRRTRPGRPALRRWGRRTARLAAAGGGAALVGGLVAAARSRPMPSVLAAPDPPSDLPPARTVAVPGHGELFFRDTGGDPDLPVVVLLHGWMFPSDLNWFTSYEPLSGVARVIAVDHRGHGRGTRPAAPFRLSAVADDVAALLRHLGVGQAVAVGYSMGGPVALLLWRRHPELVRGLVLCATAATFARSARDRWLWRGMGALQLVLRLLPRHWWERIIAAQVEQRVPFRVSRLMTDEVAADTVQRVPWIVGELARGSAEDVAEAGRELGRFDASAWLAEIDVPTAVIVTERDQLVPPDRQYDMASRIPGARIHDVSVDHNGCVVRADLFVPALVKAVEETTTADAVGTTGP